jgi:hypothetical protein
MQKFTISQTRAGRGCRSAAAGTSANKDKVAVLK